MDHLSLHDPGTDHTATTCLACGAPAGHRRTCPAVDPDAAGLLIENLPDGTTRTWTVVGARYTLTPARRTAITALIPTLTWVRPIDRPVLPFSVGALINEVVPKMGIARNLAAVGYNPAGSVRIPDCGCVDLWRCRCDFPDHPFQFAEPDRWPGYYLLGLKVRWAQGWGHLWLLDIGVGAVVLADDLFTDPVLDGCTRACLLGWCDKCPGTARTAATGELSACPCRCHTAAASTLEGECGEG